MGAGCQQQKRLVLLFFTTSAPRGTPVNQGVDDMLPPRELNRESVHLLKTADFVKHQHGSTEPLRHIARSIDSRAM